MPHGAFEEDQLDPLAMAVHHEMLELTVAAGPFAIIGWPSAIGARQVRTATAPHAVGHHRRIARVARGMDFPPILAGRTALHDVRSRGRIVDPAIGAITRGQ